MGRYDSLVNSITKDVFRYIKNNQQEHEGNFLDNVSENDFELLGIYDILEDWLPIQIKLVRSAELEDIYIDGFSYTDNNPMIEVIIGLTTYKPIQHFSKLRSEIKNLIRHEIEHLTHHKQGILPTKKTFRDDEYLRENINSNDIRDTYRYFLLAKEVDANIHGLYAAAKDSKKPYRVKVSDWLNGLVESEVILPKHTKLIYNKMKKRAEKIGGLPKL